MYIQVVYKKKKQIDVLLQAMEEAILVHSYFTNTQSSKKRPSTD